MNTKIHLKYINMIVKSCKQVSVSFQRLSVAREPSFGDDAFNVRADVTKVYVRGKKNTETYYLVL